MNIAMTERGARPRNSSRTRCRLVTGSTSGIGLGIARALAASGSAVVLNGFGKPEEIKATQAAIGAGFRREGRLFRGGHDQARTRSPR